MPFQFPISLYSSRFKFRLSWLRSFTNVMYFNTLFLFVRLLARLNSKRFEYIAGDREKTSSSIRVSSGLFPEASCVTNYVIIPEAARRSPSSPFPSGPSSRGGDRGIQGTAHIFLMVIFLLFRICSLDPAVSAVG